MIEKSGGFQDAKADDNTADASDRPLLDVLHDSWRRNNTILVNLLRIIPEDGMDAKPMDGSPSVAEMFMHIHYVRLVLISEDAPEFGHEVPQGEWIAEHDRARMTA